MVHSYSAQHRDPNDPTSLLLRVLAQRIQECAAPPNPAPLTSDADAPRKPSRRSKPYDAAAAAMAFPKKRKRAALTHVLQPRRCDYGGIGLARESLYIDLHDPSCQPRLEQEFREHVPGFFGKKQRTKSMKKQVDGQMLWRQLLQQKQEEQMKNTTGKKKKKSKSVSADERVESMLKSGEI